MGKETRAFVIYVGYKAQQCKDQNMCNLKHCLTTDDPWNIFCQVRGMREYNLHEGACSTTLHILWASEKPKEVPDGGIFQGLGLLR